MKHLSNKLACAAVFVALGFSAVADTIYNDAADYNTHNMQVLNGLEIGNEISVSPGLWYLTNFSFEYYTPNATLNSSLAVDVKFYLNDGTPGTPGTLIYDSGLFVNTAAGNIPGNGAHTINYSSADLYSGSGPLNLSTGLSGDLLPGTFTFTITFDNLGTNSIYLPLANSQAGISQGDYWLYNNVFSQWSLMTNSAAIPANFVVDFSGVPEPSVLGLGAIGGSLLLLCANKLKRKS